MEKRPSHYQMKKNYIAKKALKIVVATKDIRKNTKITRSNVALKRTSLEYNKNTFVKIENLLGKTLKFNVSKNSVILKKLL